AGIAIALFARGRDVDLRHVGGDDFVRQELRERFDAAVDSLRQCSRERGAVVLDGDVDVERGTPEEEVADRAANEKGAAVFLRGRFSNELDGPLLRVGKFVIGHELNFSYSSASARARWRERYFATVCRDASDLARAASGLNRAVSIA